MKKCITIALSQAKPHDSDKNVSDDSGANQSDRLVCTELIYRAFDGIAGFDIPLTERMGMKTLSAEDLLDLTLDTDWGSAIAIYGVGASKKTLITGAGVEDLLIASYRDNDS